MYKNIFSCKNKVALVIGGAGLIGKEIAMALDEFGAKVYIGDNTQGTVQGTKKGRKIKQLSLDITSPCSIKESFRAIEHACGRIDILVNSAYPRTKDWGVKFEQVSFESWKKNVNDHLGGYFLSSQAAAQIMKKQKKGIIINIASIYGVVAPDFEIYRDTDMTMPVAYSAIKGGIIAFTRYIAAYYAKYNVRANTISPGGIFNNQNQVFVEKYCRKVPLSKMGAPKDIAAAVLYLASDAASYITGFNLIVDGGWTAL